MAKVNLNGYEVNLHLLDADVMEQYETLTAGVKAKVNDRTQYEGKSTAECMRIQCGIIDDYLDELFGAGTAARAFNGNKSDLELRLDAFAACVEAAQDTQGDVERLMTKYSGRIMNRRERRAAAKLTK